LPAGDRLLNLQVSEPLGYTYFWRSGGKLSNAFSTILISNWKKRLQQELPGIFSVKKKKKELEATRLEEELYRQIGQLKVELDWLKKKSEQLCCR
jgi:hypothetical protein